MSGWESSTQLWVLFLFGPSPSSGQSRQFWAGTVIQSAKLVPPVNPTGELKILFHWIYLPSFLHSHILFIYYLVLSRSQSFSLCLCLSVMVMNEENNIHIHNIHMTLLMNSNVPCTCSLKWHNLELDKEFKSRLLPVCYIVTEKRKPLINPRLMPRSHQLKNCFKETGTKHLWLWLGLGLGTQTVHKLLNKECTLTQRRPRMGNIFTVVGHSCIHVDVQ